MKRLVCIRPSHRAESESGDQSGKADLKPQSNDFHRRQTDVLLTPFHIGYVAAIHTQSVRHLNLRPTLPLAELPQTQAEAHRDVFPGHASYCAVAFER